MFFAFIIIVQSCSDPLDVEDNVIKIPVINDTLNLNGIKPLKTGNIWIYQIKTYDSTNSLTDSYVIIDSVLKDTIIDNAKWFETEQDRNFWQTNLNDGLRFRQYKTGQPLLEWLDAKYPGTKGFTWQALSSQRTIMLTDTLISVTAGEFTCYYYSDIEFNSTVGWEYSQIFYSPSIGLIKSVTEREKQNKERYKAEEIELTSYSIGK